MPRPAVVRAIISNVLMTYFSATNDIECLWDLEGCMDSSLLWLDRARSVERSENIPEIVT